MMAEFVLALGTFEVAFFVMAFAALMGELEATFMLEMMMALGAVVVMATLVRNRQKLYPPFDD